MTTCFFVSDLHGREERYARLFRAIAAEPPAAVFLGGDLLPHAYASLAAAGRPRADFFADVLAAGFERLRHELGPRYPRVFVILGNDDARVEEAAVLDGVGRGLWDYAHERRLALGPHPVYGYAYVPPTPFRLKDWERFDVSRYVDPGCAPPEEGWHTVPRQEEELRYATIAEDLARLGEGEDLARAVLLFHVPPYRTRLDRAALDGKMVDHVPLDVHIGSVAVRRFIEDRQPLVTLHGHVHESARLTGSWRDRIGRTHCLGAAHDGPELALVRFDLDRPEEATRTLE